jgi:hypothetical protein
MGRWSAWIFRDSAPQLGSLQRCRPRALEPASWPHFWTTRCSCRRHRRVEQVGQPDQVVGDHVQAKHPLDAAASVSRLTLPVVAGSVLSHVGRHAAAAHLGDKALGVVGLVGPDRRCWPRCCWCSTASATIGA